MLEPASSHSKVYHIPTNCSVVALVNHAQPGSETILKLHLIAYIGDDTGGLVAPPVVGECRRENFRSPLIIVQRRSLNWATTGYARRHKVAISPAAKR